MNKKKITRIKQIILNSIISILFTIYFSFLYLTEIKNNFLSNIWFIDIFSHFSLHIFICISFISFIFLIYILNGLNKNIYFLKNQKDRNSQLVWNTKKEIKKDFIQTIFLFTLVILNVFSISYNLKQLNWNIQYNNNKFILNNKNQIKIFYQNIEWRKSNKDIINIYEQIISNSSKYVSVVENSYEFNDFLNSKEWKRISGNNHTECSIYKQKTKKNIKKENIKGYIIKTKSGFNICWVQINWKELLVVHPHPPKSKFAFDKWNLFMKELNEIKNDLKFQWKEYIIVWDFNDTIFNSKFKKYFSDSYNKSYYSWHDKSVLGLFLTLPIDHILSNKKFNFYPLKYTNSDHKALLFDINL